MERNLICPRTELCYIYRIYVDNTKDDNLGIIKVTTIESRDYYSCKALRVIQKLVDGGQAPEEVMTRLDGISGCFLIDQANKSIEKRRPDS